MRVYIAGHVYSFCFKLSFYIYILCECYMQADQVFAYIETLQVFNSWARGRECVLGVNPLIVVCVNGATVIGPLRSGGP